MEALHQDGNKLVPTGTEYGLKKNPSASFSQKFDYSCSNEWPSSISTLFEPPSNVKVAGFLFIN